MMHCGLWYNDHTRRIVAGIWGSKLDPKPCEDDEATLEFIVGMEAEGWTEIY